MLCMSEIGNSLKNWRIGQKLSTRKLAKMVGTTRQSIENLEKGDVKRPDYIVELARVMGCTVEDLSRGRVRPQRPPMGGAHSLPSVNEPEGRYNAELIPQRLTIVPLIKLAPLDHTLPFLDSLRPEHVARSLTTAADVGRSGFAVMLQNDSMANPGSGPSFPAGTVVIARADLPPTPGRIVVVQVPGSAELIVKRLAIDGGRTLLEPLNPRYPMLDMPLGARIVGVAVKAEIDMP
jgi:transcriptional regulator with XRE-family HTH domain